ncbi:hypothetical protein [Okeania sp. KiyG1]|uniref:hypothetical protein n=1 Tax=Okeania sp. KiyG1 TaxID=2720165 RepID=UPI001920DE0F|nr:hypothetical protein [Okeania sp. KiyG1]
MNVIFISAKNQNIAIEKGRRQVAEGRRGKSFQLSVISYQLSVPLPKVRGLKY